MRIIGGDWRGRKLASVGKGDKNAHLRPTSDRVRESLFNLLQNGGYGDPISGAQVLDLFAGTGALGLEALSRGADHCTFVENGRKSQSILRENIALLQTSAKTKIHTEDARRLRLPDAARFDLVFLDPPYGKRMGEEVLPPLMPSLSPNALVVWEESATPHIPTGLTLLDQRQYGETRITICEKST